MQKLIFYLFICSFCTSSYGQTIVLQNVNIIDTKAGTLIKNQDVTIDGKRIGNIQPTGLTEYKQVVINCSGLFLIPGLWDMHTHNWRSEDYYFPLCIANGVTGIREMFGNPFHTKRLKNEIKAGARIGPEIYASGPIIDGPAPIWKSSVAVKNINDVEKIIENQQQAGVDFLKVYSLLSEESYFEIARLCKEKGVSFAGHVPNGVSLQDAARAGQKSAEHLNGWLVECSSKKDKILKTIRN